MTLECPKCKSPVSREGQRFCYRCGEDLTRYYDALNIKVVNGSGDLNRPQSPPEPSTEQPPSTPPGNPDPSAHTGPTNVLSSAPPDTTIEVKPDDAATAQKASLRILLPTGDVFDREINSADLQMGKGPRNDLVIADPAVSSAHAAIRTDAGNYTITDLGSRNGTFVNGERIMGSQMLRHGDVIGLGMSKLTFRMGGHSDTAAIQLSDLAALAPPPLTEDSVAKAVVAEGLASQADVERLRGPDAAGRRLCRALMEEGKVGEDALRDLLSRTFKLPTIDLKTANIDLSVASKLSAAFARERQVFAVGSQGNRVEFAISDPTDTATIAEAERILGARTDRKLATPSAILDQVDRQFGPRLIGVLPSGEKLEFFISQNEVEVGKATHNHIVLNDPTVSNTHAILIARDGGFSIVDLGSRNGTFINGEKLGPQAHTLRHGDAIQFGQTVLTFRNRAETAANTTAVLSADALAEIRKRAGTVDDAIPAPPPGSVEGGDSESEADKKKKKKKKKDKEKDKKDPRVRAAYVGAMGRIFAAVLSVALTVVLTLYLTRSMGEKGEVKLSHKGHAKLNLDKVSAATAFQEGPFEASGVVQVPGADMVLMVDDAKLDEVIAMPIDSSGKQAGPLKNVPLGASIVDMEGITYGDGYFYVTGSQADPKDGDQNAIARFKFDPTTQSIQGTEVIRNLRQFLVTNVPELQREGDVKGTEGGLNIEGLAWDPRPDGKRLLLGLRSPQLNGQAMIVPIKLANQSGPFSIENLQLAEPHPIQVQLEGLGIRDIQYDIRLQGFLIISGAPEHHEKKLGFKLWQWSEQATTPELKLQELTELDMAMKPEGVTHAIVGGREFIFIVGDAGRYTKLDYSAGP